MTGCQIVPFAAAVLMILAAGCETFSRPTAAPSRPPAEEYLDEVKDPADKKSAGLRQKAPIQPSMPKQEQRQDVIGDSILKNADWLYFAAYCLLAMIMAWYAKKTGKQSETLQKINDTVSGRLTFRHRMLFRILRFIYRKKKKKQEEKK